MFPAKTIQDDLQNLQYFSAGVIYVSRQNYTRRSTKPLILIYRCYLCFPLKLYKKIYKTLNTFLQVLSMFPAKTIQDDLQSWATSHQDSKTKWNKLKDAWSNYAKKRKLKNESNAIYEVVLQVRILYNRCYILNFLEKAKQIIEEH